MALEEDRPTIPDVEQLLTDLITPFYLIERDMTIPIAGFREENDAEHSWSLAMLACSLAPHIDPDLDIGLICQFAIVHDLTELFAGDVSVWGNESLLSSKEANEDAALERLQELAAKFPWILETLQAYERQDSDEARYVRSIDKLIAVVMRHLDGGRFYHEKGITRDHYDMRMAPHRLKAHGHPGAAEYYEEARRVVDDDPTFFPTDPPK